MIGPDCSPNISNNGTCVQCQRPWSEARTEGDGQFIQRTYLGAVLRLKYRLVCACSALLTWNPSSEYLHTIRNETQGGIYTYI